MKAKDIMTAPVVSIAPDTTVGEIATLLLERGISGVPVLEAGRLVGLVSEGDLLHRHELRTSRDRPTPSWWASLFRGEPGPAEYVKSHARHARDIMTRSVISVAEGASLDEVASVLATHRIKRVPVLRDGRLVGIVSRADFVRALAIRPQPAEPARLESDDSIRRQLLSELEHQAWWRTSSSTAFVSDGVVHYWGIVDEDDEKGAARVAAENVSGVRRIEDHRIRASDLPSMV